MFAMLLLPAKKSFQFLRAGTEVCFGSSIWLQVEEFATTGN